MNNNNNRSKERITKKARQSKTVKQMVQKRLTSIKWKLQAKNCRSSHNNKSMKKRMKMNTQILINKTRKAILEMLQAPQLKKTLSICCWNKMKWKTLLSWGESSECFSYYAKDTIYNCKIIYVNKLSMELFLVDLKTLYSLLLHSFLR